MSLRLLLLLPAAVAVHASARVFGLGYVPPSVTRLPAGFFRRSFLTFNRCTGCGRDGQIRANGKVVGQAWSQRRALELLLQISHTLSTGQLIRLYHEIAAANWFPDHNIDLPAVRCESPTFSGVVAMIELQVEHMPGRREFARLALLQRQAEREAAAAK